MCTRAELYEPPFDGPPIRYLVLDEGKESSPFAFRKYASPILAAGGAIIPTFPFFIRKTALQIDKRSTATFFSGVRKGVSAAPTVGCVVGAQLICDDILQETLPRGASTFLTALASSGIYAVLNSQTRGLSFPEALRNLRNLKAKEVGAITLRETCFLAYPHVEKPIRGILSPYLGESEKTKAIATFAAGALTSTLGHAFDTALSRWQNGMSFSLIKDAYKGCLTKSIGNGGFTLILTCITKQLF